MSLASQALEDFLHAWAVSDSPEAPVVLSGSSDELAATVSAVAQRMWCEREMRCGTCRGCRLALARTHPDWLTLMPTKATITIKEVRELLKRLRQTSSSGRRLVWIAQAEKLSMPATHALLKSLEEPAPTTRYLLTTALPRRLPATILSRAQRLQLRTAVVPTVAMEPAWSGDLFARLANLAQGAEFDEERLVEISAGLEEQLRLSGPTPELRRAFMRLRDYYFVSATGGNTKLAAEVLVASLPSGS